MGTASLILHYDLLGQGRGLGTWLRRMNKEWKGWQVASPNHGRC